ncbi:putative ribosomal protein L35 [Viridothelium virens]|uniref:Putative ribosomal protein L35 n=1 Tax=Viridothelium virens TaxID=1048519 RepID=A0A6A6GSU0_VIRVR|nr:putative ribosomal protein L35 [Viridothelium virens]
MAPSENRVKAAQLWGKNKEELKSELERLKGNLVTLRTQKIAGGASSKLNQIHDVRKSIARVLTVINANQRHQLRLYYKNKKYLPLDLRPKQTRAMRRRLTKEEASKITEKQRKRQIHFPQRNYAVKA